MERTDVNGGVMTITSRLLAEQDNQFDCTQNQLSTLTSTTRGYLRRHLRNVLVMPLLVFAATIALAVALAPDADAASTTITVDTGRIVGPVNRRILGANQVWPLGMAGALDLTTGAVDPTFDVAMREAALTTLRYPGGTVSNLFRWERAIGPQNQRLGQTSTTTVPFDSIFGPDEYGKLLDAYGLIGNIVVNIGTGTAKEA